MGRTGQKYALRGSVSSREATTAAEATTVYSKMDNDLFIPSACVLFKYVFTRLWVAHLEVGPCMYTSYIGPQTLVAALPQKI